MHGPINIRFCSAVITVQYAVLAVDENNKLRISTKKHDKFLGRATAFCICEKKKQNGYWCEINQTNYFKASLYLYFILCFEID